ncbi:MAG: 16S rRNA (adenine(1518)-N(6)/adenine(1519)-N(6))-dimethyltransferase RsmA [bacterium]|nr:16S rRNA (adenine(1518)-N(6)/adenine(1519)-N(6))-dimethyltransferase RsmA [bacterium]
MSAIFPKKSLGQNFLMDRNVGDKIVAAASVSPTDIVIEIGPGKGALTSLIAGRALYLLAVEIDDRLCNYLQERLADAANVEVRRGDFLRLDLEAEIGALRQRFPQTSAVKIISNLPFYITTPIITRIIENRSLVDHAVVTVQKEVAARFTASPGSKRYGAITIFLNYYAQMTVLFDIPRKAFRPEPEVDGSVVSIVPRAEPAVKVSDEAFFFRTIRAGFQQRRKMLRNSLLSLGVGQEDLERALHEASLDPTLRPERLSMQDFARLADSLREVAQQKIP